VELCSESNLFFLYMHELTPATYKAMQAGPRPSQRQLAPHSRQHLARARVGCALAQARGLPERCGRTSLRVPTPNSQDEQKLTVQFTDYPTVLMRMLNQCIREPHIYIACFIMYPTGDARLDFIQNMEYKFVELLSARFLAAVSRGLPLQPR
jgi:hypothetical protein